MTETWALAAIFVVCLVAGVALGPLSWGWLGRRSARADTRARHPDGRRVRRAACGHLVHVDDPAHLDTVAVLHAATCPTTQEHTR